MKYNRDVTSSTVMKIAMPREHAGASFEQHCRSQARNGVGGDLVRARTRAGEGENGSGEQQRVKEVVDPLNLDRSAGV